MNLTRLVSEGHEEVCGLLRWNIGTKMYLCEWLLNHFFNLNLLY